MYDRHGSDAYRVVYIPGCGPPRQTNTGGMILAERSQGGRTRVRIATSNIIDSDVNIDQRALKSSLGNCSVCVRRSARHPAPSLPTWANQFTRAGAGAKHLTLSLASTSNLDTADVKLLADGLS